jgi:hypothetical protein
MPQGVRAMEARVLLEAGGVSQVAISPSDIKKGKIVFDG